MIAGGELAVVIAGMRQNWSRRRPSSTIQGRGAASAATAAAAASGACLTRPTRSPARGNGRPGLAASERKLLPK